MPKNQPIAKVKPLLKSQQADARTRIRVGMVIDTVQKMALGELPCDPQTMNARIAAARLLLAKALPDLSSVEMTGAEGGPVQITINKLG